MVFMRHSIAISVLFFSGFLLAAMAVLAQQQDVRSRKELEKSYRNYRTLFDSALGQKQDAADSIKEAVWYADLLHPERLPAWLFETPQASAGMWYAVAASDPGMTPEEGLQLARYRALAMLALAGELRVSNIREQYDQSGNDFHQNIYSEFSSFEGDIGVCLAELQIVHSHLTQYDETIILARFKDKNQRLDVDKPGWRFAAGLYTRIGRAGSRMQLEEQLHAGLNPHGGIPGSHYAHQYTRVNRIVNSQTAIGGKIISDLPALNLRYVATSAQAADPGADLAVRQGHSLRNGLWHAMLTAMLCKINDQAHQGSIQLRQIGDVYGQTMFFLSNELVSTTVHSSAPVIRLQDNALFFLSGN